ncbi:porin [Undibacterium sp. Jales W-56]|uniref:porin n=1 Tax=Undibacterium sp. Jales W-56 TaxID=2897325 RepID=UPI0021CE32AD|nr:porin [Undibacterium sp. Jales W-56]MCU6435475.1 porin [Undibacterium sp. Jales W-56]
MKKKLMAIAILGVLAGSTQAQSVQDLQQALVQAQKAAADAQKAAQQAQDALAQIQQATVAAKEAAEATKKSATISQPAGEGLVYKNSGDSIRLYGLIDLSLSSKDNANKAGNSQKDMSIAWFSGNRWGIEGEHALKDTDGLKAIFRLESEYELPTGSMDSPGVLFNRDAWLGVQSETLGKLTFGRQNTLAREFSKIYGDPYGTAAVTLEEGGYTNNNNFKQLIFYSGSATGTRYDKGIVWKKEFGNIVAGIGYQVAGIPGDTSTGTTKSLGLAYNGGQVNVAGFYNSANVNGYTHTSYSIGGNYQFGLVRLNAGYISYKADQPLAVGNRSDKAYTLSAKFTPAGKFDYELGWQTMNAENAAVNGSGYVLNAYANTGNATKTATGKRKTWYGSAFYHFDKRTELYFALDRLNTDGTYLASQANGFNSQNEYAVGMRFKF